MKLLRRCSETTMGQFRQCLEHNNISALIVEGEPTAEQLAEAWAALFLEYCDLSEAHETTYRVRLYCKIEVYKVKLDICQSWVDLIAIRPSEKINEALRNLDYHFDLDPSNPEQYKADIARINAELRSLRFDIKVMEVEYAAIQKSPTIDDAVDVKYFSTIYTRINNYYKYNAVNDQTKVEMYCALLREFVGVVEEPTKEI